MPVKIGISGAGTGAKFAVSAVAATPGAEVFGVCAPSSTRREPLCREFGGREFSDFDEMLAAKPDMVIICSPNRVRVAQFASTLAAGIDALVDKPLGTSEHDVTDLIGVAKRAPSRFVGAMLQHGFNPAVLAAERFIREGYLGVPIAGQVIVPWARFGTYLDQHYRASNNDGVILNQSPHALQAALQIGKCTMPDSPIAQNPVLQVWGTMNQDAHHDDPRCETETTAVGTFVLRNGLGINYILTAGTNASSKWTARFYGRDGAIEIREDGVVVRANTVCTTKTFPDWLPLDDRTETAGPNAASNAAGSGSSYHRSFLKDFLQRREHNPKSGLLQLAVGTWSTSLGLAMQKAFAEQRPSAPVDYSGLLKD